MQPEEITRLYQRLIKDENDIALLLSHPIPTDYSQLINKMNQDLIHLQELIKSHQTALEAHGRQIQTLLTQTHTHDNNPTRTWKHIFTFGK